VKVLEYGQKKLESGKKYIVEKTIEVEGLECGNINDKIYMYVANNIQEKVIDSSSNNAK
jgi:hypothetical protein